MADSGARLPAEHQQALAGQVDPLQAGLPKLFRVDRGFRRRPWRMPRRRRRPDRNLLWSDRVERRRSARWSRQTAEPSRRAAATRTTNLRDIGAPWWRIRALVSRSRNGSCRSATGKPRKRSRLTGAEPASRRRGARLRRVRRWRPVRSGNFALDATGKGCNTAGNAGPTRGSNRDRRMNRGGNVHEQQARRGDVPPQSRPVVSRSPAPPRPSSRSSSSSATWCRPMPPRARPPWCSRSSPRNTRTAG